MSNTGAGKVGVYKTSNGYTYYRVVTRLNGKSSTKYFPFTPGGRKKAEKALVKYQKAKRKECREVRKRVKLGILMTQKFRSGTLKYLGIVYSKRYNSVSIYASKQSPRLGKTIYTGMKINPRGFNEVFDLQVKKLCSLHNLDRNDTDFKDREEKTREVLLKKYKELCKEHVLEVRL